MTTKPKAKKFRIRRSAALSQGRSRAALPPKVEAPRIAAAAPANAAAAPEPAAPQTAARGTAGPGTAAPEPTAPGTAATAVAQQTDLRTDEAIDAIRKEGLTGRQLRMARRIAHKHGLAPTSDYDAVRLLRRQGVDPFQHSQMLELVVGEGPQDRPQQPQLPRTLPATRPVNLPSTEVQGEATRLTEIRRIQKDLARRRRRAMAMLTLRLFAFVALPTILAGYYYFSMATPMYATKSEFVIQQADAPSAGGLGGMFAGTGLAVQQDSIAVQSYLQSRDAMQRLNADLGFKGHFTQEFIDPIQRLPADASSETAYKVYQRNVKIGYDPTEGILKMEVVAADPETSQAFSNALISYAEQRVDGLTQRLREDQMAGARESFRESEQKVEDAQRRVLDLQERLGVLDPATETSALMGQISTFETQLREKRLQLQQLLDNTRPNQARVAGVQGDIRRLEALVSELRSSMTESGTGGESLARVSAELRIAEADLANRQLLLQQALQQLETARIEANRQVRYLSLGVTPVAPDDPTYPRAFENTALAFLIFGGIYLMVSLTASILREQVSA
ncbi:capsular polysaccharide transport system permease protein [Rhodovulum iodosum]|uniref:Capsular polysaccharide transport system permease protein n=1 Tax=Rhodovulum iodosum TaxID=68291 RepID=A0ABV3XU00_9RHOB|nr:capsule biosynthesis protein [Rhodovulum robiginosum]RSK32238.1 capsule biosynthesis protein [Rhodovulum robiginosum]